MIIWFLPLAGLFIAWIYQRFGEKATLGNAHIKQVFSQHEEKMDIRMAPLVLIGTWLTHLFGGSAGREGTAVQMSAAFTALIDNRIKLSFEERRLLIRVAVASGFASVFGTPLAAFFFSLEYLKNEKLDKLSYVWIAFAALLAHFMCLAMGVSHTDYSFSFLEVISWKTIAGIFLMIPATIVVGFLYKYIFAWLSEKCSTMLPNVYIRIAFGGFVIASSVYLMGDMKFIGLGVPVIESAFTTYLPPHDFIIKLLLTAFTLAVGFRGGDVTPLFFIGATLGSALASGLDTAAAPLAAVGFVGVFGTVYRVPLTTIVLFVELFLF